ncbi:uncharacterized protein LOC62_01G000087 [Vanrija pseudolonga]|uniref:Uncharacterized protein n=1 Tax=Vanrija pseudolonga TaxID=143232 RepID=A0AAF1BEI1_9TREE|nr:hypothetical protein LOC62_01G000087 [Vanrija pseudolonga]
MGVLAARRALYVAIAVLLYGTLGVAAAALHLWRFGWGEAIFVWERVAVVVWPVASSLYLIGFYFSPVSPSLWVEIRALGALFLSGVFSVGYYTRYKLTACGTAERSGGAYERLGIATIVLGWISIALIAVLILTLYAYGRVRSRASADKEVWDRRLVDIVAEHAHAARSPVDEYARLIPEREREPDADEPSGLFSPGALRTLAYAVIGLTAAATIGVDAALVHWFRQRGGHTPDSWYGDRFDLRGPVSVLVFAVLTTAYVAVRPGLALKIRNEALANAILTALGITSMSILSAYWPLINPYHLGVGTATLVLGWEAAGTLLFLLVLEGLVILRSVREGVEGVGAATFTELVHGRSLWWVYAPEERPSWYAQLSSVAAEREAAA